MFVTSGVIVYDGFQDDFGSRVCTALAEHGFRNVNFLTSGLYRFVWASENVEGCKDGKNYLVNHENSY